MGRQAHLNPLPGATRFHSKCLRARLWDPVGPRRPWAGSGVSSGPPPPSPHLWPDTSIQPLLGHRRLPQGPGPSPILPVESCLVASLERFHTRDPNPHRRRKPAGAPSRGAGEGARPTAGPRQVIQPGSPGLRPSWCGGQGLGGGAAGGAMGPRLRRGQGALAASSGAGTHGTPHTPHSEGRTASPQLWSQALGLLEAGSQGSGSLHEDMRPTEPAGRDGAHPGSHSKPGPSGFVGRLANTRSSGKPWLAVSGLWEA